ncbi:MAG: 7-cyano-7-deazaguanine synthase QueC [Thermogutta sp.]
MSQEKAELGHVSAKSKAVILLSGGMDSATAAAVARNEGYSLYALTIDYGQRHRRELDAAKRVAAHLGVAEHLILTVDFRAFGKSALTDSIEVPKGRPIDVPDSDIPVTYVPARNTVLLSLALAYAESRGAWDIFIGANAIDYSGYPDCRPEFLAAFENLANLATKAGAEGRGRFRIHAPLLQLSKAEIIRRGLALGLDYGLTHTCYDPTPDGRACGRCDACQLRKKGFAELGVQDPIPYVD